MWGVTQFSSSTLSPIRSYAESSPPRHRMVVSKKDMLFILWKLSEVRTCAHTWEWRFMMRRCGVWGVWDVSRAREVRTQESACSSSALSPARYNESSESMIVRPSPTQSVRPRLTGLSSSAPHACAS